MPRPISAPSRWVDDDAGLCELADTLTQAGEFAFDTEFHRERTYWPSLALVQVAWPEGPAGPRGVALIDPLTAVSYTHLTLPTN